MIDFLFRWLIMFFHQMHSHSNIGKLRVKRFVEPLRQDILFSDRCPTYIMTFNLTYTIQLIYVPPCECSTKLNHGRHKINVGCDVATQPIVSTSSGQVPQCKTRAKLDAAHQITVGTLSSPKVGLLFLFGMVLTCVDSDKSSFDLYILR